MKVYYQRNFEIGKFLFETIGVEESIEEGETEQDALQRARSKVSNNHFNNHPELYDQRVKTVQSANGELPIIQTKDR